MKKSLVLAMALILGFFAVSAAQAVPITFTFTGIVNSVDADLAGTYNTSQILSGTYTFDSNAPDIDGGTNGAYNIDSLTFSLGGNTYTATTGLINVSPTSNFYSLDSASISGPSVGSYAPERFGFILQSSSTVFTTGDLPLIPPDLTDFDVLNQWSFRYQQTGDSMFASVRGLGTEGLTKLAAVPEPSTLLLLGSGMVGLVGFRKKFRK